MSKSKTTAADRIRAAIAGKPEGAYAEVLAVDVVEVAGRIQTPGRYARALLKGAAAAIEGLNEDRAERVSVHQTADHLAVMLEEADATVLPASP